MTVTTKAHELFPHAGGSIGGMGWADPPGMSLTPEGAPTILWGVGTPDGDASPFNLVNKGSLFLCVNNTDDEACVYQKVDEGGDDADWVLVFAENHAKIDSGDFAASAFVGTDLLANARRRFAVSKDFNIDNGAAATVDDIILVPSDGITIVAARAVYTEATETAGADSAVFRIGTAVAGEQIVADTALAVAKAVGSHTAATLVTGAGAIAADGMIAVRHTGVGATVPGAYFVQIEYTVDV